MPPRGVPTKNVSSPGFTWTRFSVLLCWLKPAGDDWPAPLWSKITMQRPPDSAATNRERRNEIGWWAAKSHRGSVHDWEIYVTARTSPLVDLQGVKKGWEELWSLCQNLSRPSGPLVINQTITKLQMTAAKNPSIAHYKWPLRLLHLFTHHFAMPSPQAIFKSTRPRASGSNSRRCFGLQPSPGPPWRKRATLPFGLPDTYMGLFEQPTRVSLTFIPNISIPCGTHWRLRINNRNRHQHRKDVFLSQTF